MAVTPGHERGAATSDEEDVSVFGSPGSDGNIYVIGTFAGSVDFDRGNGEDI